MDFDFGASRLVVSVNLQRFLTLAEEQQWRAALYYWYYNITVFPFCYRAPMLSAFENILNFSKFVPLRLPIYFSPMQIFQKPAATVERKCQIRNYVGNESRFSWKYSRNTGQWLWQSDRFQGTSVRIQSSATYIGHFLLLNVCGKEE